MDFDFKVIGAEEFIKSLEHLDEQTGNEVFREFAKTAAKVEADAKRNAPVARKKGHQGGTLRRSITSKTTRIGNDKFEARVGTNVFYAPYQESGTKRGIPALHYLENAFNSNLEGFKEGLLRIVRSMKL